MQVGIISKEEHAKGMVAAFTDAGYNVEVLGGSVNSIPSRFDAIICRVASCSHGSFDTAQAAKRQGRFVVFENGAMAALQVVAQRQAETASTGETPTSEKEEGLTALAHIEEAIEVGGLFTPRLLEAGAVRAVDLLTVMGFGRGKKHRAALIDTFNVLAGYDASTVRKNFRRLLSGGTSPAGRQYMHATVWTSQGTAVNVLSRGGLSDEQLVVMTKALGLLTEPPVTQAAEAATSNEISEESMSKSKKELVYEGPTTARVGNFTANRHTTSVPKLEADGSVSVSWKVHKRSPHGYLFSMRSTYEGILKTLQKLDSKERVVEAADLAKAEAAAPAPAPEKTPPPPPVKVEKEAPAPAPVTEASDSFDELRTLIGMVRDQFKALNLSELDISLSAEKTEVRFKRVIVEQGEIEL